MRILHIATLSLRFFNTLPKGALMVELCIGTMALQNLHKYCHPSWVSSEEYIQCVIDHRI
jgi:hypothetical protein